MKTITTEHTEYLKKGNNKRIVLMHVDEQIRGYEITIQSLKRHLQLMKAARREIVNFRKPKKRHSDENDDAWI